MTSWKAVRITWAVMAAVMSAIASAISIWAYVSGGPAAVAQTWTVIIAAPTVVNEITTNIDIAELVDGIKKLVEIAIKLCNAQGIDCG